MADAHRADNALHAPLLDPVDCYYARKPIVGICNRLQRCMMGIYPNIHGESDSGALEK